ncbi:DUF1700 domain-containing protein [Glycomyces tarimensis]
MTDTPPHTAEIAAYQLAVERHLAELPAAIRDDLVSDLEAHLTEVAAELEPGVTLTDRLGSPEAYARELRETVEVDRESARQRFKRGFTTMAAPVTRRARSAAGRFAASAGVGDVGEFRRSLKPGWWVLRGVLAAMLFVWWTAGEIFYSPFGSLPGLILLAAITLAFVWASLRLGKKSEGWGRRNQRLVAAGGVALAAFVALQYSWLGGWVVDLAPTNHYVEYYDEYGHVTDVYVYDENGELLTGVYLFDQDGVPLRIGDPYSCQNVMRPDPFDDGTALPGAETSGPRSDHVDDGRYGYQYPLCQPREPSEGDESPTTGPSEELTSPGTEPTETEEATSPGVEPTATPTITEGPTEGG